MGATGSVLPSREFELGILNKKQLALCCPDPCREFELGIFNKEPLALCCPILYRDFELGILNREQWLCAAQFHPGNLNWEVWALQRAGSGAGVLWLLLFLLSVFLHLRNGIEDSHCAVLFGSHDSASPGWVPLCLCSIKCLGPGQVSGCPEDHRDMEVGLMTQ